MALMRKDDASSDDKKLQLSLPDDSILNNRPKRKVNVLDEESFVTVGFFPSL